LIPLFLNCDSQIADFLSGPSQKFIMSRAPAPLKIYAKLVSKVDLFKARLEEEHESWLRPG
jgi:hypothetical protein